MRVALTSGNKSTIATPVAEGIEAHQMHIARPHEPAMRREISCWWSSYELVHTTNLESIHSRDNILHSKSGLRVNLETVMSKAR